MGFAEVHNNIRIKFTALVSASAAVAAEDVEWDNVVFDRPATTLTSAVWLRVQVLTGQSIQRDLGAAAAKTTGVVVVGVFTSTGKGDRLSLDVVDEIVAAFRTTTHVAGGAQVNFRTPSVTHIGLAGAWWQTNVTIPFHTEDA